MRKPIFQRFYIILVVVVLFFGCNHNDNLKVTSVNKYCMCYTDSIKYITVIYTDSIFNDYILKRIKINYDNSIKCDTVWYEPNEFIKLSE